MKTAILILLPFMGMSQIYLPMSEFYSANKQGKKTYYSLEIEFNDSAKSIDDTVTLKHLNSIVFRGKLDINFNGVDTIFSLYTNNLCVNVPVVRNYLDLKDSLLTFHSIGFDDKCNEINDILRDNLWYAEGYVLKLDTAEVIDTISSVREIKESQFSVFPNPARDFITIRYGKKSKLLFTNLQGNQLEMEIIEGETTIDISEFTSGIYFLSVFDRPEDVKILLID